MTERFLFIGDPGSDSHDKLKILESLNISPKRCETHDSLDEIENIRPKAIMLGTDVVDMESYIVGLRERRALSSIPIIGSIDSADIGQMDAAYRAGVDDVLMDGQLAQWKALASSIMEQVAPDTMRAPAGLAVLAHQDRVIRMKVGQLLRKNGYGIHFAASTEELEKVVEEQKPRVVIVAGDLPSSSPLDMIGNLEHRSPWVVIGNELLNDRLQEDYDDIPRLKFVDAESDLESLVFVMNDLLAPEQVSERRTPRILYGRPVSFRPENGSDDDAFLGYTYNVNIGGLFIRTLTPPPMQSRLTVSFNPPFGGGNVVFTAQVVWQKRFGAAGGASSPPGIGVQIVDALPADTAGFEAGYNILREKQSERRFSYSSKAPFEL